MALGYCPSLLLHLKDLQKCNYTGTKVTTGGFLKMLLEQRAKIPNHQLTINGEDGEGHYRPVTVKYRNRVTPSEISDSLDCDIDKIPAYSEQSITRTLDRKFSFMITDETIAQYCREASTTVAIGRPATSFMNEHLSYFMQMLNGFLGSIDQALLAAMATNFGTNVVTGSNAAQTVNIKQDATVNDLTSGITKILADAAANEMCGPVNLVGSGLMNNFMLQQAFKGLDSAGIDTSRISGIRWFNDFYASSAWGSNQVGAFEDNAVHFVDLNRYVGFRAGQKGTSTFLNLPVPVECAGCNGDYSLLGLDVQLKYQDCPESRSVSGYESNITVDRGWQVIVSKSFGLFVPNENYASTDRLNNSNGTLRYTITNS